MIDPAGYVEWDVPAALRRYAACTWTGGVGGAAGPEPEPVLPDGCIDVIWDGRGLFVAGPDTGPAPSDGAAPFYVGLRFRPGMGPLFLGVPAVELRDRRVPLDEAWTDAPRLAEDLAGAACLRAAAALLERRVQQELPQVAPPDLLVEAAARAWAAGATTTTAAFAARAGVTERQLHRRFVGAVGYGPKLLQRILRLQSFLAEAAAPEARLGEIAATAGYADQPHLNREARALTGLTPAQLRANRLPVPVPAGGTSETSKTSPAGPRRTDP